MHEIGDERGVSYLHGVERATGALRVELDTNDIFTRCGGRFDTFNGGVIAIDEEGFPAGREVLFQLECVLVILTTEIN